MLAPVGNRILTVADGGGFPGSPGFHAVFVNSGTAALALALLLEKRLCEKGKNEVVIPAYACPDLVTACIAADLVPVICDLEYDQPGYSIDRLESVVTGNTLAVIAVNFLGVEERLESIRQICQSRNIAMVQDNAQWFPETRDTGLFHSDYICFSFGRGKPVSLLGGGALLLPSGKYPQLKEHIDELLQAGHGGYFHDRICKLKMKVYNNMLNPFCYGIISGIPLLKIGATRYSEPEAITAMDSFRHRLLNTNIQKYQQADRSMEDFYKNLLQGGHAGKVNLPVSLETRSGKLLRYPVLAADRAERDNCLDKLTRSGLGSSSMYHQPLWMIENIPPGLKGAGQFPGAESFANRLITLPVHEFVTSKHKKLMKDVFTSCEW